ncbi:DUF2508 family protein [Paenibacillus sp. GbtcB18]|uniref:DUF2508 family protein n=1 Tax=Paenibacillus sp. GbtcB18 TaxID=2824763 RepID=UPI001C2FE68B|nr:DUF2508 family protein [Paenibacillus sp. GbtcB18]
MNDLRKSALSFQRGIRKTAEQDKQELLAEIRLAHSQWKTAQHHFEHALEKDEIDYAIYAIEAAEKRYEMLLRQAKKLNVTSAYHITAEVRG